MTKLEQLIQEKCPNGVEYKRFDEVFEIQNGFTPSKKIGEYWENGDIPWFRMEDIRTNGGILYDSIQHTTMKGIKNKPFPKDSIIFATTATIGEHALIKVPFMCNQQLTHIHINDEYKNKLLIEFIYHYSDIIDKMCVNNTKGGGTMQAVSLEKFKSFELPVPPLKVQCEIVEILDKFTLLTAELTAELTARKQQFQTYLDKLYEDENDKRVKLSSLGTLQRGKRFVHADTVDIGVPCIHYGELYTYYGVYANKAKSYIREDLRPKMRYASKNDVIIVGAGENNEDIGVGVVWDGNEDVAVHDACYTLKHNQNPKYISYFLRSTSYHKQIKKYVSEGKICAISAEGIGNALIPLPSIDKQNEIVKILDSFYSLTNDIKEGIPAEIEARQKQYEYYRDKLLAFKKAI